MSEEKNKIDTNENNESNHDEPHKKVKYQVVSDKALNWILDAKETAFEESKKPDGTIDVDKLSELITMEISKINDTNNMKKDYSGNVIARKLEKKPISESGIKIREQVLSVENELNQIKSGNSSFGQKKKIKTSFKKMDLLHNVDRNKIPQNTTIIRGMVDWTERDFSPELVAEINEKIRQVESESIENKNIIDSLQHKITELEENLTSKNDMAEIEKLTKIISDLEIQLAERPQNGIDSSVVERLESKIADLESRLAERPQNGIDSSVVEKLENKITDLESRLAEESQNEIDSSVLEKLESKITDLETQLDERPLNGIDSSVVEKLENKITNLEARLAEESQNDLDSSVVEKLENEITDLKSYNEDLADRLNDQSPIDNINNEELDYLKKQVEDLKAQLRNKSEINEDDVNSLRQHVKELELSLSAATNGTNVHEANDKLIEAKNIMEQTSLEKVELNKILQKINEQSKRLKTLVKISYFITGFLAEMGDQNPLIKDHDYLRLCQLLEKHNRFFDQQEYIRRNQRQPRESNRVAVNNGTTNWSNNVDSSEVNWTYKNTHRSYIRPTRPMNISGGRMKFKHVNLYYNEATN